MQAFNKAAIWWISHSSKLGLDGIFNISISYLEGFPRSMYIKGHGQSGGVTGENNKHIYK
jgi:hypothetical protein